MLFLSYLCCVESILVAAKHTNYWGKMPRKLRICYQNLGLGDQVSRKYHDVLNVLSTRDPQVLFISETLIDLETVTRLEAKGFLIEAMPKTSERIWCAVRDTVNYKRLHKYELDNFPAIWLEIGSGKSSYYICGLYREFTRPGNAKVSRRIVNQRARFSQFLDKAAEAAATNKEIHLLGDWNLNYARWIQNNNGTPGWKYQGMVDDLYEALLNKGFVQTVNKVTRVSGNVESILDLHLTNKPNKIQRVLLTSDTKSDHLTMTLTRGVSDQVDDPVIEGRSWRKVDWHGLKRRIYTCHKETLRSICMVRDANEITNRFLAWANVLLDDKTPVKRTTFKTKFTPWMNPELLAEIRDKNKSLRKWQRTGLDCHRSDWLRKKTKVSNHCKKAQHDYWEQMLTSYEDPETVWGHARKYTGEKKAGSPAQVVCNGRLINDPTEVATECNKALLAKVVDSVNAIPPTNKDPIEYTRDYVASKNFCTFTPPRCNLTRGVGYKEVKKAIKGLRYTNATGHDMLCTRFVKMLAKPLLHVFTVMINRSLEQCIYPDPYKLARVCLLCKDITQRTNMLKYRPVSVLPAPSKVLEAVVVNRLVNYMERTSYFPDQLHGYRARRSCQTAVLSIHDEILRDLEDDVDSVVVFCDLSAAFDTLDHEAILQKLRVYGFTESSIAWYRSYLSGRAQYCQVAGCNGTTEKIERGLPQGSLSGPQIFNVVFGDVVVVQLSNKTFMIIYADDLTIKIKLCGQLQLDEDYLNKQLSRIQEWMDANKLLFNPSKTELLVVSNRRKNIYKDLKLTMRGQVVTQKTAVRMLGLYLTHNLRMDYFIHQMKNNLVASLNHRLHILRQLRPKCGPKQFKILACGIFTSKLLFGCSYYWQTTEVLRDKIRVLTNDMVRLLEGCRRSDQVRLKSLYKKFSILRVDSLVACQDLNLLWSIRNTSTPWHMARRLEAESAELRAGPQTRARTNRLIHPLTRENQGVTKQRSEAFLARALRRANALDRSVTNAMALEDSRQKQRNILRDHYITLDYASTS